MAKQSAGLLVYRRQGTKLEVLIVHPGGPFWAKKDAGAWSIPKGEFTKEEDPQTAAAREFQEELGIQPPAGEYLDLGSTKLKSGKVIYAWAVEGDLNPANIKSNTTLVEWPPKTGKQQEFPEVDKASWCTPKQAIIKLNPAQIVFVDRLLEKIGFELPPTPEQISLL